MQNKRYLNCSASINREFPKESSQSENMKDICVIGAGAAGLAAAKHSLELSQ